MVIANIYQKSCFTDECGGLAQLVERVLSMHEVVSSILTFSIFVLHCGGVGSAVHVHRYSCTAGGH